MDTRRLHRFGMGYIAGLMGTLLAVVAFNVAVDLYGALGTPVIAG